MDVGTLSLVVLLLMLLLLAIGMPLGFASAFLAVVTLYLKFGPDFLFGQFGSGMLGVLAQNIYGVIMTYTLISVPLFIFMANLLERSGIAEEMYSSLNVWLNRTRGGIAIVTSIMAVIMAAMSGIIGGEVVLLGLIALPQMLRLGYNQNLAIGTICASGSLGTMIPPSIVLIMYGLITETSIKALFTASFLPGFMLASFFILYIILRTQLDPSQAPLPEASEDDMSTGEKWSRFTGFLLTLVAGGTAVMLARALFFTLTGQNVPQEGVEPIVLGMVADLPWLVGVLAVTLALIFLVIGRQRAREGWELGKGLVAPVFIIFVVLGSIYGGITGITEAAAMGATAVFCIAAFRGRVTKEFLLDSVKRTIKSTGTIIWVTLGAATLAGAVTLAGIPTYAGQMVAQSGLPTMGVILAMMLLFLVLGAFMDWVGIVLLVMPIFLPIVKALPVQELGFLGSIEPRYVAIWFGVVFCMNMQVSFLSPPFGPAAFYLKSVAPPHISLTDIFKGFLPFIGLQLLALSVLLIWPNITTVFLAD